MAEHIMRLNRLWQTNPKINEINSTQTNNRYATEAQNLEMAIQTLEKNFNKKYITGHPKLKYGIVAYNMIIDALNTFKNKEQDLTILNQKQKELFLGLQQLIQRTNDPKKSKAIMDMIPQILNAMAYHKSELRRNILIPALTEAKEKVGKLNNLAQREIKLMKGETITLKKDETITDINGQVITATQDHEKITDGGMIFKKDKPQILLNDIKKEFASLQQSVKDNPNYAGYLDAIKMMETKLDTLHTQGMTIAEMEQFTLGNNMLPQALYTLINHLPTHQSRQEAMVHLVPCIAKIQEITLQVQELILTSETKIYNDYHARQSSLEAESSPKSPS